MSNFTSTLKNNESFEHTLYRNVFTGLYYAELLGGKFSNCYGQGSTPESAITSLKIRIYQLRKEN